MKTRLDSRIGAARSKGFTIVELLVVISIIALLIGILLPAIGKARDAALTTKSAAQMRNLSAAHNAYSADWSDRQWTCVPDDAGYYLATNGGANWYTAYVANGGGGCPPQMILGWDADVTPTIWGYFLPCYFGSIPGNYVVYQPNSWTPTNIYGSFRLMNAKSFNVYLNGRFYDPVFYAPKDSVILAGAEKYFGLPDEFTVIPPDGTGTVPSIWNTTYIPSPAAMWGTSVLSRNTQTNQYWTNPNTLAAGYKSPPAGAAVYPDLKTRVIEHHWLQNKPNSDVNYFFAGGYTPWYFNHGYSSAPITAFYDGSVRPVGCGDAMDADSRATAQSQQALNYQKPLWSRNTPIGATGYYYNQRYDFVVNTSFHILTVDGIAGRDVLGVK